MKICFCTPKNNFRVFVNEFYRDEKFPNNFLDKSIIKDLPFVGFIKALNSDFKFFENLNSDDLNYYDYIFYVSYVDEIPNIIYNYPNKFIYIPTEPQYSNCYEKKFFVFNTYNPTKYNYSNVFFYNYVYDLEYFNSFRKDKKEKKIFRQKRSPSFNISEFSGMYENFGNRSYLDYFEQLSKCKYSYSLCNSDSPGQTTAESSIVGVINFACPNKLMSQRCLPDYCLVNTIEEVEEKIFEIENDQSLYNSLLVEMNYKVQKNLSLNSFKKFFFSFVDK